MGDFFAREIAKHANAKRTRDIRNKEEESSYLNIISIINKKANMVNTGDLKKVPGRNLPGTVHYSKIKPQLPDDTRAHAECEAGSQIVVKGNIDLDRA